MTHAQILATAGHGWPPSDCPGPLRLTGSYPDHHIGNTGPIDRTIAVYRCAACGVVVAVGHDVITDHGQVFASGLASEVLNVYSIATPADLVSELARRFASGPGRVDVGDLSGSQD